MLRLPMVLACCYAIAVAGAAYGSVSIAFSSLLGAGGWERAQGVWLDAAGDIYLCGSTQSSSFPVTAGAYDVTYNSTGQSGPDRNDAWVAKLSSDGTQLLWATYLGGTTREDCYGVMTDSAGNVFVTGWTFSSNFPTTSGAYDQTHNGSADIFITKLNPQGTQILASTLVGGSGIDQSRGAMAIDPTGVVYFAGYTESTNCPTTAGAVQSNFQGGGSDAVIGRLSADFSSLDYSTYLGSSGPDTAFAGVYLHDDDSLSVVGAAGGPDFPVTSGAYQTTYGGSGPSTPFLGDAFATRMTIGVGSATVHFTTFLGGNGDDLPLAQHAMTGDDEGTYVYIRTDSTNLPTSAGAYQTAIPGSYSLYLGKISYDGTSLVAGTYIGGAGGTYEGSGVKVSPSGRLLLSGSVYGSTTGHPVTANAAQPTAGGSNEGFFMILSRDMSSLDYSTFVGGSADERVRDLAVDITQRVVIAGDSWSTNFPTTTGTYQQLNAGEADGYVVAYDVVPPPACYSLTLTNTGSGAVPTALPTNSSGCPTGEYLEDASVQLTASPAAGWSVASWSGTDDDSSTWTVNTVTMPSWAHTATVNYVAACHALTLTKTGAGAVPTALPTNSTGCSAGEYVAGESVQLTASPDPGWGVSGWSGTDDDASTSTTNTVMMPASLRTVNVTYEQVSCNVADEDLFLQHDSVIGPETYEACSSITVGPNLVIYGPNGAAILRTPWVILKDGFSVVVDGSLTVLSEVP